MDRPRTIRHVLISLDFSSFFCAITIGLHALHKHRQTIRSHSFWMWYVFACASVSQWSKQRTILQNNIYVLSANEYSAVGENKTVKKIDSNEWNRRSTAHSHPSMTRCRLCGMQHQNANILLNNTRISQKKIYRSVFFCFAFENAIWI